MSSNGESPCAVSIALAGALASVSGLLLGAGLLSLWAALHLSLLLSAVFFFELGSLLVSRLARGPSSSLYYALRQPADDRPTARQAIVGRRRLQPRRSAAGPRAAQPAQPAGQLLAATSLTDRLTGLYNYGTFVDYLAQRGDQDRTLRRRADADHVRPRPLQAVQRPLRPRGRQRPAAACRGHAARRSVREADMAARYGGEEFALLHARRRQPRSTSWPSACAGPIEAHRSRPARRREVVYVTVKRRRCALRRPSATARRL